MLALVVFGCLLGLLSLLPLLLVLELQLLKPLHRLLVLTDLDDGVGLVVEVRGGYGCLRGQLWLLGLLRVVYRVLLIFILICLVSGTSLSDVIGD